MMTGTMIPANWTQRFCTPNHLAAVPGRRRSRTQPKPEATLVRPLGPAAQRQANVCAQAPVVHEYFAASHGWSAIIALAKYVSIAWQGMLRMSATSCRE